jgi:hypothetical protein
VAIDWADQKHYWSLRAAGVENVQRGTLDNTSEAVEAWMVELHLRFGQRPIAVGRTLHRGVRLCGCAQSAVNCGISPSSVLMATSANQHE